MPNWCNNSIRIMGNPNTIRIIKETIERCQNGKGDDETRLFKNLVGYPEHLTGKEINDNWYHLHIDWFGTKWDVDTQSIDFNMEDREISFWVETAWSPPIEFLKNLVLQYENIEAYIFYSEGGCDFCGETNIYKNPEGSLMVDDNCYDYFQGLYLLDNESFWSEVEYITDCAYENISVQVNGDEKITDEVIKNYTTNYFAFVEESDMESIIELTKQKVYEQIKRNESSRTEEQTISERMDK